ncbi:MAG TPA: hypothetical protein VMZ53_00865 [Kofleriaceae bacterium]|nr:hypothetical protein [Kofleriaceae bacterium]
MRALAVVVLVAACGRFGFAPDETVDANADADVDALVGTAHVDIHVAGVGAVNIGGTWCAGTCGVDLPLGPVALQIVPGDGQEVVADTSVCPLGCDVLRGDSVIDVTFAPAITANVVFITSIGPALPFGGLSGADAFCQQRAVAGGLSGTFIAMLSTTTVNLRDRLTGRGWVRRDGRTVFDLNSDVFLRQVNPIALDEFGNAKMGGIFPSATNDDGTVAPGTTCGDWTAMTGLTEVRQPGFSGAKYETGNNGPCDQLQALFCAEVGKNVPTVAAKWPFGRYAFLTSVAFDPALGIAAADALCGSQASAASLPGTYRALLADVGTTAASRFTSLAGPWRRTDGALITLGDISGPIDTPLNRAANGGPAGIARAWLGGYDANTVGTAASTCNGWTTNASGATGAFHFAYDTRAWAQNGNFGCPQGPVGLFCLQE